MYKRPKFNHEFDSISIISSFILGYNGPKHEDKRIYKDYFDVDKVHVDNGDKSAIGKRTTNDT